MEQKKLIPISEVMEKLNMSRGTIDRKVRAGVLTKYSLPGSSKVFMDEVEINQAFVPHKST